MTELKTREFFEFENTSLAYDYVLSFEYPWQSLSGIGELIWQIGEGLDKREYKEVEKGVWVAHDSKIAKSACILPPCIIDKGAEVRHCAYIRGNAIVGKGCVIGNSCEIKNSIIFDRAQIPHYNYVGDSIIGYRAHMGAGSITSNIKSDKTMVTILKNGTKTDTGLRKMGAIIGDFAEIGCGTVLNPGSVIGASTTVYPLSLVRGYVSRDSIYKAGGEIVRKDN